MFRKREISMESHPESATTVYKTARVVLEKLKIPSNSVILVRDGTITYKCDSEKTNINVVGDIKSTSESSSDILNTNATMDDGIPGNNKGIDKSELPSSKAGPKSYSRLPQAKGVISDTKQKISGISITSSITQKKLTTHSSHEELSDIDDISLEIPEGCTDLPILSDSGETAQHEVCTSGANKLDVSPKTSSVTTDDETALKIGDYERKDIEEEHLSEKTHVNENENKIDFTPSRISQRIKNKKVKFSALKLLAGSDYHLLKKEINNTSTPKKTLTPKRLLGKTKVTSNLSSDVNVNSSDISPVRGEASITEKTAHIAETINKYSYKLIENKNKTIKKVGPGNLMKPKPTLKLESRKLLAVTLEKNNDTQDVQSVDKRLQNSEDLSIHKSASGISNSKKMNDKLKVNLQDAPLKKTVNISTSPKTAVAASSNSNETVKRSFLKEHITQALGPDIIIRRVRSESKPASSVQNTAPTNVKSITPASLESLRKDLTDETFDEISSAIERREDIQDGTADENLSILTASMMPKSNIIIKNLVYPAQERTSKNGQLCIPDVEVPRQIKPLLQETFKKNKEESKRKIIEMKKRKKLDELSEKKTMKKKRRKSLGSSDDSDISGDDYNGSDSEVENRGSQVLNGTNELETLTERTGSVEHKKASAKSEESSSNVWVGGKKTAKVTPLRHHQKHSGEQIKKSTNLTDKHDEKLLNSSRQKLTASKSSSIPQVTTQPSNKVKTIFTNSLDRFFTCSERVCEHNDSLDSDSSFEDIGLLSHFIDVDRKNPDQQELIDDEACGMEVDVESEPMNIDETNDQKPTTSSEEDTLSELFKSIGKDLPKWNCHVIPESSVICLFLLERGDGGVYDVKKCIEIDKNYITNVFVNKELVHEYSGQYDSYDAIKSLIYQIELL